MTPPDLNAWRPWSPQEVFQRFAGIEAIWCFVGGWAIDLWLGVETRAHEDIEVTVLRDDLDNFLATLPDCDFFAAGRGRVTRLAPGEIPPESIHQIWCLDRASRHWVLDVMIEPGTNDIWRYKRDPTFAFPRRDMIKQTAEGLPILRPEAIFLFKAKETRAKDEEDLQSCLSRLPDWQWLIEALQRFHPKHPWLRHLAS